MAVPNFFRRNGIADKAFHRVEQESDEEVEIDLPSEPDELAAEVDTIAEEDLPWEQLCDCMAHELR